MSEDGGAIKTLPKESVMGKLVDSIPAQLLSQESFNAKELKIEKTDSTIT